MVLELDLEGAVVLKFGGARTGDLVHFVEARSGEADLVGSVVDVQTRLHGPEGDLALTISFDHQGGRAAEIKMVAIPQVRLDKCVLGRSRFSLQSPSDLTVRSQISGATSSLRPSSAG